MVSCVRSDRGIVQLVLFELVFVEPVSQVEDMALTIDQIAAIAGVGRSTVSRALSPTPQRISASTRQKVLRVVKDLNYMPNASARLLGRRHTQTIGFYWNHGRIVGSGSFARLIEGISRALAKKQYNLLLSIRGAGDGWNSRITSEKYVDGIIIGHDQDLPVMAIFRSNNIPVVLAHAQLRDDCDCTLVDDQANAELCVEYLWKLGHRRIGYVDNTFFNGHISLHERVNGYVRSMAAAGAKISPDNGKYMPVADRIEQLFKNPEKSPTALLCYDDLIAVEVIHLLRERNLNIPKDVGVVSFNDSVQAREDHMNITSVHLPIEKVGESAASFLLQRLENPDISRQVIKHKGKLVVRGSTEMLRRNRAGD